MKLRPQKKTNGKNLETTLPQHSDEIINSLAFKYLKLAYPVLRNKINGKFKRTIVVDEQLYSISSEKNRFLQIIINNVSSAFGISQSESRLIIFDYFKIKNYQ